LRLDGDVVRLVDRSDPHAAAFARRFPDAASKTWSLRQASCKLNLSAEHSAMPKRAREARG